MRTQTTDDQDTLRFRGPSLEEAVALAEQSLGTRVRVVAANRIRRGGIGGFFASDLGVEVIVLPETETVEDALERLINDSASADRSAWESDRGVTSPATEAEADDVLDMPGRRWLLDQAGTLPPDTAAAIADALAGVSERTGGAPRRRPVELIDPADPTTNTSSWWEPPAVDRRRELERTLAAEFAPRTVDVVDLMTALAGSGRAERSAEDVLLALDATPTSELPVITPEMLRPVESTSVADSPGLVRVEKIIEELQALTASPRLLTAMKDRQRAEAAASSVTSTSVLGTPRSLVQAEIPSDTVADTPSPETTWLAASPTTSLAADRSGGPSQHQVELAVAAADQLLESLSRDEGVRRISVRIVLRTADHDEVQAEADWEATA